MLKFKRIECRECGCLLWSERAKEFNLCPDCEDWEIEDMKELESEEKLEYFLK